MANNKLLQSVLDKVSLIDRKLDQGFKDVNKRFDETDKRIDKIGLQVANLEDDTPTIEEYSTLGKRVSKLEHQITKN